MRRETWIFLLLAATTGTVRAQVPNLRTGDWNVTVKENSGGCEVVEVRTKLCLKKEDIDVGEVFRNNEDAENCKTTLGTRSATRVTGTIVCTGGDASRSTYEIVAHSPETMTMKTKTEGAESGTVR